MKLHRNETDLFDVALTNWFFFTDEYSEEVYGPKAKHVGFHEFFKVSISISCVQHWYNTDVKSVICILPLHLILQTVCSVFNTSTFTPTFTYMYI